MFELIKQKLNSNYKNTNIEKYGIKEGHFGHKRLQTRVNEGCREKRRCHEISFKRFLSQF